MKKGRDINMSRFGFNGVFGVVVHIGCGMIPWKNNDTI